SRRSDMKISVVGAAMSTQARFGSGDGSGPAQPPRARERRRASDWRMAGARVVRFVCQSLRQIPSVFNVQADSPACALSVGTGHARENLCSEAGLVRRPGVIRAESAFREVAATFFRGPRQQPLLRVVEFGPGAETVAASDQSVAVAGSEAVVLQAQLAVTCERLAAGTDIGALYLKAIAHLQRATAGLDLKVAVVIQAAAIHCQRLQVGFLQRLQVDPGLGRVGLGHPQRAAGQA